LVFLRDRASHPFILKTDRTTIICPVMPLNGERAFEIMQREGVDTLVASSTENVYYVSNYWSLGKRLGCGVQAYAVLPLEAVPAIVAPFDEADLVLDSQTWIEDIRFHGSSKVEVGQPEEPSEQTELLLKLHEGARPEADGVSALLKTIVEKGLAEGVIALDTSGLTPFLYEQIKSKLPGARLVDGASLLQEIRLVKTEPEVERIKRATAITEKSMEDALEIARSEITELDLAGMYAYSVSYDGGQVTQNQIGFRERSAFPNPVPSLFEAARKDLVRMTFGCTWDHYHSNISRTAVIGRPLQKVQRRWEAVMSAQDTALDAVEPGAKIGDVCGAALKALEDADVKGFSGGIGHGLGVECNERPWIERDAEGELLEGMVVNIDIPVLELGWGGTQLEDTILVTSEGFELLTRTDRTLYLL
jgi:Xaa-Pro aminopeptidase